jgi:hypothetical protein
LSSGNACQDTVYIFPNEEVMDNLASQSWTYQCACNTICQYEYIIPDDCASPTTDTDQDGAPDCIDVCPQDPEKDLFLGECGCGVSDGDTDGDGKIDCEDACPNDSSKTTDTDTDSDGVADCVDQCQGEDDSLDADSDGTIDCLDACPNDPSKTTDVDTDEDGTIDCLDDCPNDSSKTTDVDTDGDGTIDCLDICPTDADSSNSVGVCGCGVPTGYIEGSSYCSCDVGFMGTPALDANNEVSGCKLMADSNDDGAIDIRDVVALINYVVNN